MGGPTISPDMTDGGRIKFRKILIQFDTNLVQSCTQQLMAFNLQCSR